jgi:hypothetical protein
VKLVAIGAVMALVVTGCGSLVPTSPASPAFDAEIQVVNSTTLDVTVNVNGADLGVVPAHQATTVPAAALPAKPWAVEAHSPSGRVLLSFEVAPGQVTTTTSPDGVTTTSSAGARVDLTCGRLDVTVGTTMMGPPPPANPGVAGDCDP